jgi:branched-chain amino acid transport system permease protein
MKEPRQSKRPFRYKWIVLVLFFLLLLALPKLITSRYQMHVLNMAIIYVILVSGYNIMVGVTGQTSFCQPAFWGIGAYASSILAIRLGFPFLLSLALAALIAMCFGILLGLPTLKLSGKYLALVTIGFVEITRLVLLNWRELTGGANGISSIPSPVLGGMKFSNPFSYYYIILFFALGIVLLSHRILNSATGRALEAIRENELAAEVIGINTYFYKIFAFGFSAFSAGIAGSLYAHFVGYIEPDMFSLKEQVKMLCMLFIGGSGSIAGAVIGAVFITFFPEWLRFLKDYYIGVYGLGVVLLMIFMPKGLVSLIQPLRGAVLRLSAKKALRSK